MMEGEAAKNRRRQHRESHARTCMQRHLGHSWRAQLHQGLSVVVARYPSLHMEHTNSACRGRRGLGTMALSRRRRPWDMNSSSGRLVGPVLGSAAVCGRACGYE